MGLQRHIFLQCCLFLIDIKVHVLYISNSIYFLLQGRPQKTLHPLSAPSRPTLSNLRDHRGPPAKKFVQHQSRWFIHTNEYVIQEKANKQQHKLYTKSSQAVLIRTLLV